MSDPVSEPDPRLLGMLIDALVLLAKPPDEQIQWLTDTRVDVDELALLLDDVWPAPRRLVDGGTAATIDRIYALLGSMSGQSKAALWQDEALQSSPEWSTVRALAGSALAGIDE